MMPAISCLRRGKVSAEVCIFSPPRLLVQEPRGQQRQGLVMMPGDPVPHLIVGQARLAFASLDAALDLMCQLGHSTKFLQRGPRFAVRQIVIMLERAVSLTLARDEQKLLGARASLLLRALERGASPPRSPAVPSHRLEPQSGPCRLRQRPAPTIDTHERNLRASSPPRVFGGRCLQVTNRCVRRDRQQVLFAAIPQFLAKPAGRPISSSPATHA